MPYSGSGAGTEGNPYLITTANEWKQINDYLAAYWKVMNNLTLPNSHEYHIGQGSFIGNLDGNKKTITVELGNALFFDIGTWNKCGYIKNLAIVSTFYPGLTIGNGLLTNSFTYGNLFGCSVQGIMDNQHRPGTIGGFVGMMAGVNSKIKCCSANVVIVGREGTQYIGGLVGYTSEGGLIEDCFAIGEIYGGYPGSEQGGLIGRYNYTWVKNCYSATVLLHASNPKGIAWTSFPERCISTYWDTQYSGCPTSQAGVGKTTAQMKQKATFVDWDFNTIWAINEGVSYPYLDIKSIATKPATSVLLDVSALLNGQVNSMEGQASVDVYFKYRIKGTSPWTSTTPPETKTSTGTFSKSISGLSTGTIYEFKAIGTYGGGIGDLEGGVLEFTTVKIETKPATLITASTARLNGQLHNLGIYSQVNVSFRYRVKSPQGAWVNTAPQTNTAPTTFFANISGLAMDETYEFQARCEYTAGSFVYGGILELTTLSAVPPTVTTVLASALSYTGATLNGNLASKGDYAVVDVYFKYRVQGGMWQSTVLQENKAVGNFSQALTGLQPYVNFEFKAIARFNGMEVEGEVKTFRTSLWQFIKWEEDYAPNSPSDNPITITMDRSKLLRAVFQLVGVSPEALTIAASTVGMNKATLNGRLVGKGSYSAETFYVGFRYREYRMTWQDTPEAEQEGVGEPAGNFSYTILGLKSITRYQFQAKIRFLGEIIYGSLLEFITEESS